MSASDERGQSGRRRGRRGSGRGGAASSGYLLNIFISVAFSLRSMILSPMGLAFIHYRQSRLLIVLVPELNHDNYYRERH